MSEGNRLEGLWAGDFGNDYITRNADASDGRAPQWEKILTRWPARTVLEVGCNVGGNLTHIAPRAEAWGIDINSTAIRILVQSVDVAGAGTAPARALPFRDNWFELTFTAGVLIHQPSETLLDVMAELVRCSSRWVLAAEYDSSSGDEEEVPYRGQSGALIRRNYGDLYQQHFPELTLIDTWFCDDATWDQVTFWVLEKS